MTHVQQIIRGFSRRRWLATSAGLGAVSLPAFMQMKAEAAAIPSGGKAKSCIIVFCWGGMSHLETFDLKPNAPREIRGEFNPIATATPGVFLGEHLPRLANHTERIAIVRSMHHTESAHGRGLYWNLTGRAPPRAGNLSPTPQDWPSLPSIVSKVRPAPQGVPPAVRVPYPMIDHTLQAGEFAGFLGRKYEPIIMRPAKGIPFEGVSRSMGCETLELGDCDVGRTNSRKALLAALDQPLSTPADFGGHQHFQSLASDILLGSAVRQAYDLDREDPQIRASYGEHLGGQSLLLARRLTEVGVPVVQVCCAAGDLNGSVGDMWDTHSDNFNRLKNRLLPVFDRGVSALLQDLSDRGTLDETLVVVLTDFGRTPQISGNGRDHYPGAYSVMLAGGGIKGGQVYGSSDAKGAEPRDNPTGPADIHATMFHALGISPKTEIRDRLGRPFPVSDGNVLPLL